MNFLSRYKNILFSSSRNMLTEIENKLFQVAKKNSTFGDGFETFNCFKVQITPLKQYETVHSFNKLVD